MSGYGARVTSHWLVSCAVVLVFGGVVDRPDGEFCRDRAPDDLLRDRVAWDFVRFGG